MSELVTQNTPKTELMIPSSIAAKLPTMVKNSLAGLPAAKQEEFMEEYKRRAKSVAGAYLCQFLGAHYFYLRKSSTAWMFWLTGGGLFCWWFIDLFRIPKMVTDYNRDIATDIIRTVKILS